MKLINKIAILVLISSALISCKKKEEIRTETTDTTPPVTIEDTRTNPLTSYDIDGVTKYDICCNPNDLDNQESLLSERVILFSYDQATVESKYRDIIAIHARYLSQNPSARVVLEGHADERGTPEYNLALGEKRGNSVANLLRSQGASTAQVSVVSYGEEKPAQMCSNESCWSQNRRVRIVYTSK
jgi:peptidoglycan-associated lipoprotein